MEAGLRTLTVEVNSIGEAIVLLQTLENLPSYQTIQLTVRPPRRRLVSAMFAVPALINPKTGEVFPMSINIPNDAIASVPLLVTDQVGNPHAPSLTAVVAVLDPAVATAALSADGAAVLITPLVLNGSSAVTYTDADDNLTATEDFTIITPGATSAAFNEAGVTFTANPTPPTV